jgi:hypothetical protein
MKLAGAQGFRSALMNHGIHIERRIAIARENTSKQASGWRFMAY